MGRIQGGTKSVVTDAEFGRLPAFTIGVEEELLLVGDRFQLIDRSSEVIEDADPDAGDLGAEIFKPMIESRSEISTTVRAAVSDLCEVRRELCAAGERIMGTGVHPAASTGEAGVHDKPRYELIEESLQGILRTPICGQHIHVGMPDAETAVRVYNGLRLHVPLLNALAANSPFWFGRDSGLASSRTVIFRSYPRAAMAPAFRDFEHFRQVTEQVCLAGDLEDYTQIWWDVRLHPNLGTIEVRAADTQFDLDRVGALAALVHCLARLEAERPPGDELPAREALAESSFQATRHGLAAKLLNRDGQPVPARELGRRTVDEAAVWATELDCEAELAGVADILEQGCGADLQRAAHASAGMDGLLEFLVERTASLAGEPV